MKSPLIFFVLALVFQLSAMSQVTCEHFDYANSTTVPGWNEAVGDWQIIDSSLHAPGTTVYNYITLTGSTQTDGCITLKANYNTAAQVKFVGIVCRYTDASTRIMFKIQDNSTSGHFDRCFIDNNGSNLLYFDGNFGLEPVIQLEYSGTSVTARVDVEDDGVWDYEQAATVSNVNSGLCGVAGYGQVSADDFCYGATCCEFPAAAGSIIGSDAVCQGDTGVYFQVGTIANADEYIWEYSGTGVSITGTTEQVQLDFSDTATGGDLTVYGHNVCGDGTVSSVFPITVYPLPDSAAVISGTDTVCAGETAVQYSVPAITNAQSYHWSYSGTNVTVNGTGNSVTLDFAANATSGTLTVEGENTCGYGQASPDFEIVVLDCSGIEENMESSGFQIMPNPNDGRFVIVFDNVIGDRTDVSIFNVSGQVVYGNINLSIVNSEIVFELHELPEGLYTIIFSFEDTKMMKHFLIQK